MPDPIETIEGWYAFHDFRRLNWSRWWTLAESERKLRVRDLQTCMESWQRQDDERQGGFGAYRIMGHKADLLWLAFGPTLTSVTAADAYFKGPLWASLMEPAWSYLSVVELSQYMAKGEAVDSPHLQRRLKPSVPTQQYLSFYPMSKRRVGADNWYMLDQEQRRELMKAHGILGHRHRGQVAQIITGSQGLDDFEWGVTLFADDPIAFKKIVYEMRFDESTARFGEFGSFHTGIRLSAGDIEEWV